MSAGTVRDWNGCRRLQLLMLLFPFALLAGCNHGGRSEDEFEVGNNIQTHTYNYTHYEVWDISVQDAAEPFDVRKAAPGGSTPFDVEKSIDLGSGISVHTSKGLCCFDWKYHVDDHVTLQVKWRVVYDRLGYNTAIRQADERLTQGSFPGTQWCEARVEVPKPYPESPGALSIHFLPDGALEARISAAGKVDGEGPLSVNDVLLHPQKSDQPLCRVNTANPWYKIPRQKHIE